MSSVTNAKADSKMIKKLIVEVLDTTDYLKSHDLSGLETGQNPDIFTLFCGDSRVQADVFVSSPLNRMFGNEVIGNQVLGIMGSAAYPTQHLASVKLVNIAGHVSCGAVGAAYRMSQRLQPDIAPVKSLQDAVAHTIANLERLQRPLVVYEPEKAIESELAPMAQFFANIRQLIGEDSPSNVRYSAANVALQTSLLMRMPHISRKVEEGSMCVIGTVYDFAGVLGKKGVSYLVDMNGSGRVSPSFVQGLNGYSRNVIPAAELVGR